MKPLPGAKEGSVDTNTVYVFDPPKGAWFRTPLAVGDLCLALGQRRSGNVDVGILRSSVCKDKAVGTYLGVVSPECLRPATAEESANIVIPPPMTRQELEASWEVGGEFMVVIDQYAIPMICCDGEVVGDTCTHTGFRGTFAECCRHAESLYDIAEAKGQKLLADTRPNFSPSFDPKGRYLYFTSNRDFNLTLVNLATWSGHQRPAAW